MIESDKLNHKNHRMLTSPPTKCTRPIGAHVCGSTRFVVYDELVNLRGIPCRRHRCQECNADYFVAAVPVLVPM